MMSLMREKGFAPILLILLIAAAIGGYFIFTNYSNLSRVKSRDNQTKPLQQTSQPSASGKLTTWETYTNKDYAYEFRYHSNWQLEGKGEFVSIYPPSVDLDGDLINVPSMDFEVLSKPINTYPTGNMTQDNIQLVTDWKKVTIGGLSGISYQTRQCAPQCKFVTALPLSQEKTLEISINTMAIDQGYRSTYDEILSTITFLDKETVDTIRTKLPSKSPDGKEINSFWLSSNSDYVIFATYVKQNGAGSEHDFWVWQRSTNQQINLSKLIKENSEYKQVYKDELNNNLFLSFYDRWIGDDPIFSVSDGWNGKEGYWMYDLSRNNFVYVSKLE